MKKEEEAKKEYEEINTSCRNELDQFRLSKQRELLAMLADLAQTYMNHELRVQFLFCVLIHFKYKKKLTASKPMFFSFDLNNEQVVHLWKELLEFLQDSKQQLESSQTKNNTNL